MDAEAARFIAKSLCIVAMLGTAIGEGYLAGKALEAIGRNPKIENSIFSKVIISIALVESTAIYALVAFFTL